MIFAYPHTIDNGHGEELTFLQRIDDENGGRIEAINRVSPGAGPPMHVHFLQDETLTVVEGKMAGQIEGKEPVYYGPGDTATFKRGEVHRFWNAGDDVLICKGWITPPHNIEYFLTEIFSSIKANGGKGPALFDGAYLMSKYKTEYDLMIVPAFVKKLIFPLVVFLGKLVGKYHKYANAPEAMRSRRF